MLQSDNNGNSNTKDNICGTIIMAEPLQELSVSLVECRAAHKRLPTFGPSQLACTICLPVGY